jgi:hypothetical protein
MKSEKEIRDTLEDCIKAIPDYELSNEGGDDINKGWIEALQYTLGDYSYKTDVSVQPPNCS